MGGTFLTASDVARRWACDPSYVRKLARRGLLVGMRLGADWRFSVATVEAYEARQTTSEPAPTPAAREVSATTADGFTLPSDFEPVFPDLWPGHEPRATKKRPLAATKRR